MASKSGKREEVTGEILVAWQKYKACGPDELNLREGDVVELLDTIDPGAKRLKLDPEFEGLQGDLLDHSAAKHKLSVKPRRTYTSSRHSPTRLNTNARWLVREISGGRKEGWVPCKILQTIDDPTPGGAGLPGDAAFRRQAVVKELVETEQEFVKDLDYVVQNYLIKSEGGRVPKIIKDNFDVVFSNLKEIAEFHRTVLMEGLKYYANEPLLLGKAFLRLERDFDKHVNYCKDEPSAQIFLESSDAARTYFEDLSQRLGDDKSIAEHLKLPIQRINDYQLLIKELVRYSSCLGEDHGDLQKALELMLSIPHRAQDDKFTSSIEGYRGSIYKLGRLLAHDWFSVTFSDITKERYLFLFKARILICKVRRISDDRSVFQLKDIVRLTQVEVRDHPEEDKVFELVDKSAGHSLILTTHRERIKEYWLQEIREFAKDYGESEESDEFQIASPPTEASNSPSKPTEIPNPPTEPTKSVQEHTKDSKVKETTEKKKDSNLPVKRQLEDPEQKPLKHKENPATKSAEKVVEPEKKSENKENLPPKKPEENKESNSQVKRPLEDPHPTQQKRKPSNPSLTSEKPKEVHTSSTAERTASIKATEDSKSVTVVKVFTREEATVTKSLEQTSSQSSLTSKTSQETTQVGKQEEHHTHHLKAVEPLVHISDHRVLEQPVPFTPPVAPELVPGSAYNKVLSVEKVSASDKIVDGDFRVGVEINVEVDDMSSRKYTSSALSGGYESSYGRKSASYSSEGGYSSRHSGEITSGRYGTDSAGTGVSKYDEISSKYSKSYTDEGDTGYTSNYARKSLTGAAGADDAYSKYTRRSVRSSAAEDDDSGSFSRRSIKGRRHDSDGDSYSYARKSVTALTGSSLESKDGDNYTYSRKSIRASADLLSDGDSYVMQKSLTKSHDGSGEIGNTESYSYTKKGLLGDEKSYSKRSLGGEDDFSSKYGIKSTSAAAKDDEEDIYSKYSRKYSRTESLSRKPIEEEDYQSKYSRKYSRNESVDNNKAEEEDAYTRYKRKYSRTDSQQEKKSSANDDEDVYAKYTRKYSRTESADKKSLNEEDSKYSRSYSRTDSADKKKVKDAEESKYSREYSRTDSSESKSKESEELKYSRAYSRTESAESKNREEDVPKYSRSSSKVDSGEKKSKKSKTDSTKIDDVSETRTALKEETVIINGQQNVQSEIHSERIASAVHEESLGSISTSLKMSRESESVHQKTATEKLLELDEGDGKPKFIKNIHGTNLEPGETAHFEVALNVKPDNFCWLKDNKPVNGNGSMSGRIQQTFDKKTNEYKLTMKQISQEDAGLYSAIATCNSYKASCSAQLIVHELTAAERAERTATDRPEFLVSLKDTELLEDTYLRFMVKVRGDPNPDITFFKDGVKIPEDVERIQIIREHSDLGFYELVIPDVKHTDAGSYKCVAANKFGEASSEATVTVTDNKQAFEDMPEGEILEAGKKPSFLWKKDGQPFEPEERFKVLMGDDEDSLALVFQHVRPDDVGLYTCVAQTSQGHISCSAELTVHGTVNQLFREPEKPQLIIDKREPIVVNIGGSAMLELQVKGFPRPNVKVTHKGKSVEASDKYKFLYEDEESMSLVIKKVDSEDAGIYTITAENDLGTDTAEMSLIVKAPPKIKAKVQNVDIHADLQIQIPVEVEGIPKPTVHFYKDGKEIKKSDRIKLVEEAEKHILIIEKCTLKDTGSYSIVAQNELAQVSDFWSIDVHSKPKLLEKLGKDKQVSQGEKVDLKVKIEAEPKAEVKWFKDEEEIKSSEHFVIKEEAGGSYTMRITGAVTTDSSRYKVKAVNIHGSVEDEVRIDVKKAPKIIKSFSDMTVTEHDKNVTFDVSYEAFPKPTIKWYLDEMEITETKTEFTRIESDDGAKLVIKEVSSELSGKYTCKLSNECGAVETSAKLTVNCAPRIIKHLKDTTVDEGATLHLEIEVEACPTPTVKWLRNGREISADARIKISRDTQRYETYNLAVNLIKYEEQGEYEVYVTNALGTVSSKSYVTVQKVTHTDAVEETEEPEKKLQFKVVESDEEREIEPKETDSKKKGFIHEKFEIEEKSGNTPEPIIEEPQSPPCTAQRTFSIVEEDMEIIQQEENRRSSLIEEVSKPKSKRAKSIQIEEIEETLPESPEKLIETDVKNERKVKRGLSAKVSSIEFVEETTTVPQTAESLETENKSSPKKGLLSQKESAEHVEQKVEEPQTPQEDLKRPSKLKRGISAKKESIEIDELDTSPKSAEIDTNKKLVQSSSISSESNINKEEIEIAEASSQPSIPLESNVEKPKLSKARMASKETAESVEVDDRNKSKEIKENGIEPPKYRKAVKSFEAETDDEVETLLNRAKRQRSIVEDISVNKLELKEAEPTLLDTNMKDGSRPESLDITYIVRGTANPLPVATWTHNGQEIKPDGHLRMTASQNGEEFKLEIKKLELKDAGTYQCTLSNALGEVKQQAVLEVTPEKELRRPKLKKGIEDQTIVKKNSVTFKAVVIGEPVPEVTWFKDGKEMTSAEYEKHKIILESEDHDIEDTLKECTYSLTIPRCERCNAGKYTMKAKNKWGECDSSAELTIILRPEIEGPEDVTVIPGEATQFTCIVQSNPVPEVTWLKDGQKVVADEAIEIIEDAANETYKLIFHKVKLADDGYYVVSAKNHLGESSSEARLKTIKETEPTTERPKIITGLEDEPVEDGGEVTVMVRADGLPKPEIRWFFMGKPIVEDENHIIKTHTELQVVSSLTIKNYKLSDVGLYKAVAVNCVGEADSNCKISMLQTPPSFIRKLERSEEINEGEPLELKTKISGSPKPTVAWYKNGELISPDDDRIKTVLLPDGTVKLNIESVKPEDSGAYKLVVKNANGENSCLCAVAVQPKPRRPKFLKCIKDTKVAVAEQLRLEAQIEAYPPPDIKWLKDGLPVRPSSNINIEKHPDGRVALVIDCMKPENAGRYEIMVTNRLGEATGEAKVEVEKKPTKPEFATLLQPQTVVEGFPVKFEVKAKAFPPPKITWIRNGAEVVSDNKHIKIIEQPDGTSALLIDSADIMRDALTYRAVAINEAGECETSALLTITPATNPDAPEERPLFLHGLRDVITDEGQPLILSAPFTGNPIPSVEWWKDGTKLEPSERMLMTCDGKKVGLTIDSALPSDAGQYSVTLENPLGKESSEAKASVHKVFMPPSFTQRFTDLQQLPKRDAKFPCRVSGVPQPDVTWSKDGVNLGESDKYHMKRDGDLCCLYVLNCEPEDAGVYRATATNKEGQDVCTATLEVVEEIKSPQKVEPPVFLKRIGDTELYKGMTAKFTACASGFPEPKVEWFHNDEKIYPSSRIRMETDTAGLLRLSILGIDQDDLGKYSCKISNDHGSDICHATLDMDGSDAKTKRPIIDQYIEYDKYKRSGAPMPLSDAPIISQMTDRHCTLSWRPSIPSAPRAPVTYQLEMCELPTGDWFTVRSGIRSCICDVRNLEPFRDYKFRIRVENKYGISDPSPYAITHREKLEPDLPKFRPYLPPEIDFRPETSPYFPRDFDIERPPHDNMAQAPRFLRQEHDTQYGVKDQNTNLFWFVYGYPKPNMSFYFNDELIEPGGRFDTSYTRNGQATLFINKMLDRDVGWYEAVARNEHGEARQRVRLDIAEIPTFIRRPDIEYVMLRGRARFEARILGVPYPEIKWYKDWKPLAISSRTKIQFVEPDVTILIINDVIGRDEGLYSVSARNVAGSTSSSAMLHIEENDHEYSTRTYANLCPIKAKRRPYTDLYDIGDELGRGTQGVTYHAVERLNGRNYAAKMMYGRDELRPFMYNELDMLNELHHRRLISLHDSYEHDDSLVLILELGAGGELVRDHLLRQEYYTESDISGYIRQLLQGLHYMHDRGYAHLGLNLGDLLISHAGGDELKITDFGLTRRISMANTYPLKYGMPEYVSPECASGLGVGFGHDMWSVGIITFILLSGRSPFRGIDDMETLTRIREGRWLFEEEWWSNISLEARDFISKLLVYQVDGRMDVYQALRHPWLERADKQYRDEFRIRSSYLDGYWRFYREWYDNASCKRWFRRRPLEGAFTHPSRMVYPPNERYTPPPVVPKADLTSWEPRSWEDQLPSRSPLNYEIGAFRSESHYQNGPDTYLLQLRDVDFPVRLREYMKVAANRGPGSGYIVSDENGYDWRTPIIRERRRFTDIMDEEIDDERKARINRYGADEATAATTRRLKHELGSRLDTYVEAEAFLESKHDGRLPFFREKPQFTAMVEAKDLELTCLAVGEPEPIVQWFKNDAIIAESHRIKIYTDQDGRSHFKLSPALAFDQGLYKVVARNKIGQTVARTRIVYGMVPDEPDSPQAGEVSSTEILLTWKLPKFDGHSPVLCYRLDYKLADGMDWTKKADNIDHEFYLFTDLQPNSSYIFRLAAKNEIGWSDSGVPSAPIQTKSEGAPRIQLSKAMLHLQQITDSGQDIEIQRTARLNYSEESNPVEWREGNAQEQYDFISEISSGRFSSVLKAIDKQTDQVVIVKLLEFSPERQEDVEGEFAALRSLRNERVASLLAAYRSTENQLAVFILEKLQGADVLTYLASRHEYTEQTVATIVSQTLDGLQYLHWRGLCHLDLQPDNIVMCNMRSVQIKLVDLGSAHRVTKMGTKVPVLGHPDYISPEVLSEEPAFPQTDIWTVGVLTYLMLSGTPPFKGENEQETKQNILFVRYRFEHLYQEISQEATRFIMLLFKRHPNKRPSAEECHENRWLLPTDCMIKKRERAVFLGHRLQEYSEEYHKEKTQSSPATSSKLGGKSLIKSHSIQEELLTAP